MTFVELKLTIHLSFPPSAPHNITLTASNRCLPIRTPTLPTSPCGNKEREPCYRDATREGLARGWDCLGVRHAFWDLCPAVNLQLPRLLRTLNVLPSLEPDKVLDRSTGDEMFGLIGLEFVREGEDKVRERQLGDEQSQKHELRRSYRKTADERDRTCRRRSQLRSTHSHPVTVASPVASSERLGPHPRRVKLTRRFVEPSLRSENVSVERGLSGSTPLEDDDRRSGGDGHQVLLVTFGGGREEGGVSQGLRAAARRMIGSAL